MRLVRSFPRAFALLGAVAALAGLALCGCPRSGSTLSETVAFNASRFRLAGELRLPGGGGPHPAIDGDRIGVWGASQAAYVVASALGQSGGIAFMILVGAPGENGVQQTACFVGQQVRCDGHSDREAAEADSLAAVVLSAQDYDTYAAAGEVLVNRYPAVKRVGFMAGVLPRERWTPRDPNGESFFDPMPAIAAASSPALVFFGALDKNVDPAQGVSAYRAALESSDDRRSRVVLFPGVDHDMVPCRTGCEAERSERSIWRVDPGYLDAMVQWLRELESSPSSESLRRTTEEGR